MASPQRRTRLRRRTLARPTPHQSTSSGCFSVSLAKSSAFSRRRKTPRDALRLVQLSPKGEAYEGAMTTTGFAKKSPQTRRVGARSRRTRAHLTKPSPVGEGGPRQRWMRCHAQSNGLSRRRALQDCAKLAQTVMRGLAPAAPCAFTPPYSPRGMQRMLRARMPPAAARNVP